MDYKATQKKTAEKLKKAGKEYILTVPASDSIIDPVTGEETPGTAPVSYTVYGLELSPSFWDASLNGEAEGTNILRSDKKVMLAAVDVTGGEIPAPSPEYGLTQGGETLKILSHNVLKPGTVALYYEVMCRG